MLLLRAMNEHIEDEFVEHLEDGKAFLHSDFLAHKGGLSLHTIQVLLDQLRRCLEEGSAEDLLLSQVQLVVLVHFVVVVVWNELLHAMEGHFNVAFFLFFVSDEHFVGLPVIELSDQPRVNEERVR